MREQISASGVVVRDNKGSVIASKSRLHEKVASAFAAEALACRDAVQVGVDMQKKEVIIEGDSLIVIKKCRNVLTDISQIGSYIFDIHYKKPEFKAIRFDFISRSVNSLAHLIATESLKNKEEIYLVGGVPIYAEAQARNDTKGVFLKEWLVCFARLEMKSRNMGRFKVWEQKQLSRLDYAKDEAQAKFHRLIQQRLVREYVRHFSELMLQIFDMGEKEALMRDCLKWSKISAICKEDEADLEREFKAWVNDTQFCKNE
ncbi:glycine, alanine and asparagine-rich protein-like [Gossypium australe]|uniref:Glycine, alanine and asparagine-rich protein-like n=1 Tax=Gossypium australe TaxID=47621 RepID=A0A5B6WIQ7_9ROSI|nr:glycine, alanine and asparagine-rich protein-like [Gossypium australe]